MRPYPSRRLLNILATSPDLMMRIVNMVIITVLIQTVKKTRRMRVGGCSEERLRTCIVSAVS